MSVVFPLVANPLHPLADPVRAEGMAAYMKHRFAFLGIQTPVRRRATKEVLRGLRGTLDTELVDACWSAPEREFQYVACDHLREAPLKENDLPWLRSLVTAASWWDTVDALAKPIGRAASPRHMRAWARDEDLWVRRAAILHQLGRKDATDVDLLAEIILANLGSGEFFLDKAVGWALRDYARTDASWVRDFLAAHADGLSALTRREASKHL